MVTTFACIHTYVGCIYITHQEAVQWFRSGAKELNLLFSIHIFPGPVIALFIASDQILYAYIIYMHTLTYNALWHTLDHLISGIDNVIPYKNVCNSMMQMFRDI